MYTGTHQDVRVEMENLDLWARVLDVAPNMMGFLFATMMMSFILRGEWGRYERLREKYDSLQSKTIEIALKCNDQEAKAEMLEFQRQQTKATSEK